MGTPPQGGSWLRQWFGGNGPGSAEALQALLSQILQQETALACHLAERARALRFGPHRLTSDVTLRGKLEGLAADEARGSQTIRAILARMDSYVTDLP